MPTMQVAPMSQEDFHLFADNGCVRCPLRPELDALRKLIPAHVDSDFELTVHAIRRNDGDGEDDACPFATDNCSDEEDLHDASCLYGRRLMAMTPAHVLFALSDWGGLRFEWPFRDDVDEDTAEDTDRPTVNYRAKDTDTGADLRRALHEVVLPRVHSARADVLDADWKQVCVTRDAFEARVAQSMETLAAYVDSNGGTFGAATLPGAHDAIVSGRVCWDSTEDAKVVVLGTRHWWYKFTFVI
jgi:hypothetical protein